MNLILIGFKHCGKTSVGQALARRLNQPFIDTDLLIERAYNDKHAIYLSKQNIYHEKGAAYFRALEKQVITDLNKREQGVIATGGGAILDKGSVAHLKTLGPLIYLYASLETLLPRLNTQEIPAILDAHAPEQSFKALYEQREPHYKQAADRTLSTEHKSIATIADELLLMLRNTHGF